MSPALRIRLATVDDIPGMHRVRMHVRENRLADPALIQPRDYEAMLTERGRGWVAEVDGRIAGFAVADASGAACGRCSWTRTRRDAGSGVACTTR